MLSPIDNYFLRQEEPGRSCMLAMRHHILRYEHVTEALSYGMPFYFYKGKRFCFLWTHKKRGLPYLGVVEGKKIEHPDLIGENRTKMKILLLDPQKDLPLAKIDLILKKAVALTQQK
jgi:hypothetical protein